VNTLAAKCETLIYTCHMKDKWIGKSRTDTRIPRCNDALYNAADLFVELRKDKNVQEPVGVMLKGHTFAGTWDPKTQRVVGGTSLPPAIEPCTPWKIREWIACPPHYNRLSQKEKAADVAMSPADAAIVAAAEADAKARTAEAELELAKTLLAGKYTIIEKIIVGLKEAKVSSGGVSAILQKRGVATFEEMTDEQLSELLTNIHKRAIAKEGEDVD